MNDKQINSLIRKTQKKIDPKVKEIADKRECNFKSMCVSCAKPCKINISDAVKNKMVVFDGAEVSCNNYTSLAEQEMSDYDDYDSMKQIFEDDLAEDYLQAEHDA